MPVIVALAMMTGMEGSHNISSTTRGKEGGGPQVTTRISTLIMIGIPASTLEATPETKIAKVTDTGITIIIRGEGKIREASPGTQTALSSATTAANRSIGDTATHMTTAQSPEKDKGPKRTEGDTTYRANIQ